MSYVEQFDVKHKRLNEPIKERERAMEHTHISDTVKMVSVLHHFFIAPASAAIFPFVLNSVPRTRCESFLFRKLYCYYCRRNNGQQWATLELLWSYGFWVWSEDEERCEVSAPINCATLALQNLWHDLIVDGIGSSN